MTIELVVQLLGSTTQAQVQFQVNEPKEIYKIHASMPPNPTIANVRGMIQVHDGSIAPETLSITDGAFVEDIAHDSFTFSLSGGTLVLTDFDPITITQNVTIDHIISNANERVSLTLYMRPVEIPQIQDDLTRDLAERMRQVDSHDDDITAGQEFFQTRIRGLRQVSKA